jgi:hypothetical protein
MAMFQYRIFRLLIFLIVSVFTIYPVLDACSDYQNIFNDKLDSEAGYDRPDSEVDSKHDGPANQKYHLQNTHLPAHGYSLLARESTFLSEKPCFQYTGSIIPITEKSSHLSFRLLSSDPSPPVI